MNIQPELFDQFYAPLVGGPDQIMDLERRLTSAVTGAPRPYNKLETALDLEMNAAARQIRTRNAWQKVQRTSIGINGTIGSQLTVGSLETLGDIYATTATVAQREENVMRNVHLVLGHIFATALTDRKTAMFNTAAQAIGLDPRNPANTKSIKRHLYVQHNDRAPALSPKALGVTIDTQGQLGIRPLHRNMPSTKDSQCPAAKNKVQLPEGRRSGLYTLMQATGNVAVHSIYPRYFDIIPTQS